MSGRVPHVADSAITLNGHALSKRHRRAISYVTQSDLLFDNLTVLETLQYAALLKLPHTLSRADKLEEAQRVLSSLGLDKVAHSLVGSEAARGVSGGEKKRVNVGVELLAQPQVLVLDGQCKERGRRWRCGVGVEVSRREGRVGDEEGRSVRRTWVSPAECSRAHDRPGLERSLGADSAP